MSETMSDNDDRLLIAIESIASSLEKQLEISNRILLLNEQSAHNNKRIADASDIAARGTEQLVDLALKQNDVNTHASVEIKTQAKAQAKIAYQELQLEDNE